ncbi:MAG: hypothetical protein IJY42_04915, partial [Clostridia bacterium]|nr:hypothetical protein [Clostridia bacterium]
YLYGTEASTSDVSIAAYKRNTLLNTMYGINIITIVADESRNITAVDKTSEIVNSTGVLMSDKTARGSDVTPFTNGTSLTMAQCLYVANQVRVKIGTAFEYGILVMPKLYEADEYASYCYGLSSFAVPDAAKDIHLSAVVLDCMNWLSSNVSEEDGGMGDNCLTSVYYKGVVQGQLVDSPEDVDMLQLTRDTVYFDFGYIVNFKVKIEDSFRSAAIAGESVGAKMTAIVTYAESGVTDMMEFYNR